MNPIDMSFKTSGERIFPSKTLGYFQHLARYEFASQFVKGKTVLDVACGAGYGSSILSKYAKFVYGIDVSNETIAYANEKYQKQNISFIKSDARRLPLKTDSVDIVISLETLEHIFEQDIFLAELKRLLHKDGILVISTPDKSGYSKIGNIFHKRELDKKEFLTLLRKYFKCTAVFNQNSRTIITFQADNNIKLPEDDCSPYLIGVCSDKKFKIKGYAKVYDYIDEELLNTHMGVLGLKERIRALEYLSNLNEKSKILRLLQIFQSVRKKYLPKSINKIIDIIQFALNLLSISIMPIKTRKR